MKCNQICEWNSNVGCIRPYGVPCILGNVSLTERKTTNADCIRNMSDDELAKILGNKCICPPASECVNCFDFWLEWLKQQAETPKEEREC